jgi:hypothetical protein
MTTMVLLVRQLIHTGMIAFAILLVLLATTGIHVHADHDDHDHHHASSDHDHHHHADYVDHDALPTGGDPLGEDDSDGHDGILFHSHDVLADLMSPQVVLALGSNHYATTAKYRTSRDAVPDHPARDIDPPPNKRVL